MENGDIPDENIHASSVNEYFYAWKGRLNRQFGWSPDEVTEDNPPWIQADIGYVTRVTGVIIQGGAEHQDFWVTSVEISTSYGISNYSDGFVSYAAVSYGRHVIIFIKSHTYEYMR